MKTLILFLLPALLFGQRLTVTAPTTAQAGQVITYTVAVDQTAGTNLAALMFGPPAGSAIAPAQPAGKQANKGAICSPTVSLCVVFGAVPVPITAATVFNAALMTDAPLMSFTYTLPATPGPVLLSLGNMLGASTIGAQINLTQVVATVTVLDPRDLNKDGKVDWNDALAGFNALAASKSPADFLMLIKIIGGLI